MVMQRVVVNNVIQFAGYCPVPRCQHKQFTGDSEAIVLGAIREHLKKFSFEDQNHSDIAEMEEWL